MEDFLQTVFGISDLQTVPGYDILVWLLDIARLIFISLDIALVFAFIYALRRGWKYRPDLEFARGREPKATLTLRTAVNQERWKAIVKKGNTGGPDALRIAVIEADALVNDVLRQMGLEGEHMADRLSQLEPADVGSLQRVWRAHRLRNDLVHTPGFFLSDEDAAQALEGFEAFLREVQAV